MNSEFQGKRALVTGGNKGIGFAICQGLLQAGFEVIIAARSLDKAKAATQKLPANSTVRVVKLDVTDDDSIHRAAEQLKQEIDSLDVLVNNAGVYQDQGVNILNVSRSILHQAMDTNTFGSIHVTQAFLPLLQKATQARVINVSSGYGELDGLSADVPSYCLSKLALNGATIMLAEALQSQGIAVYAMCPGWVKTDMGGENAPRSPEQGADTAIWLATEASLDMSGKFFRDRQEISY
ncbi:SDR family NAD(P)-dependent oxidoreductase [Chroogloeocystis siderophila]|jgi:NAD(P)-dependent dehydrogenase (short-subunit alcohol dehydrogenase family)|uniref:Short-chain dehydrogenase n=1 Tax=Chroogloeocystis siderophila 5.2 s.c.1 TaxID=247279 RepID=A0A1U7HM72_9CHRO|nr:SDR family NAD(P)-dependent oxidoreductase [Chroogloeocystis siderophila]OKH24686.1 short-chain dehydrogenase [Chroogloeocystis siderophila 5.2 s.c.1]